ncbi:hypothetical protein [Aeromicrobium fastidiosum]|uniref:Uncharacterized protein n=1 Tax=Aeromicrobium fastidiosum TaxID=52699 RepID=A0A641ASB3_9ACTN|nr:hypothetical protein [Aeromicrobium fastidiosum]KAA1380562.1 hypothetical protein ESP62_005120 [Aeromicrobium fastidiosum]MBP2390156.1 hypothetical protein [Aeromicrobium fastidiosum]
MNYFLIVYNRSTGESDIRRTFTSTRRSEAMSARFELEDLHRGDANIEIVVLGADSEQGLMKTHSRYFRSAKDMIREAVS